MSFRLVTTQLARQKFLPASEVFGWLRELGWMNKKQGEEAPWTLTEAGIAQGAAMVETDHGTVPAWPEEILDESTFVAIAWAWCSANLLDAKDLAIHLGENLESWEVNAFFADLGWIEPCGKGGWKPTEAGYEQGAIFARNPDYLDYPHVRWPESVLANAEFRSRIANINRGMAMPSIDLHKEAEESTDVSAAKKLPLSDRYFRTNDGHWVRSKAEALIDNWLYSKGLVHAYEPPLPGDSFVGDFYLPSAKLYIEFWGLVGDPAYDRRRKQKTELYKEHGLRLLDLTEAEMSDLDKNLKRLLRAHQVNAY